MSEELCWLCNGKVWIFKLWFVLCYIYNHDVTLTLHINWTVFLHKYLVITHLIICICVLLKLRTQARCRLKKTYQVSGPAWQQISTVGKLELGLRRVAVGRSAVSSGPVYFETYVHLAKRATAKVAWEKKKPWTKLSCSCEASSTRSSIEKSRSNIKSFNRRSHYSQVYYYNFAGD